MGLRRVSRFIIDTPSGGTTGQVLTRDTGITEGIKWADPTGGSGTLPSQTGNNGKYLTTDGSAASWGTVPTGVPTQTGNASKFLTTDGTNASWSTVLSTGLQSYFACKLYRTSSATLTLAPYRGNSILIGGVPYSLPAAGVTYGISGSPANGLYWVLASLSGGSVQLTLAAATGGSAITTETTTYGYRVKSGSLETVVGAAYLHSATFSFPAMTFTSPNSTVYGTSVAGIGAGSFSGMSVVSLYHPDTSSTNTMQVLSFPGAISGMTITSGNPNSRLFSLMPFIGIPEHQYQAKILASGMVGQDFIQSAWSVTGTGALTVSVSNWKTTAVDLSSGPLTITSGSISFSDASLVVHSGLPFGVHNNSGTLFPGGLASCSINFAVTLLQNKSAANITLGSGVTFGTTLSIR